MWSARACSAVPRDGARRASRAQSSHPIAPAVETSRDRCGWGRGNSSCEWNRLTRSDVSVFIREESNEDECRGNLRDRRQRESCGLKSEADPERQSEFPAHQLVNRPRTSGRRIRDRKSTRLNSSHTVISYAVFCLKKKKKMKQSHSNTTP